MKLDQSMVGKAIRNTGWDNKTWLRVEWIKDYAVAGTDENGRGYCALCVNTEDWEVVELSKLPSERILEIARERNPDCVVVEPIDILKYFDEKFPYTAGKK